ncbi:unnamed protein product [Trifolium pratense]|uniref:Uncharacterized protein n=1 Tax=Trifolium pratense TaxID=57577 RepID=A0ACB0J045_TRIPR|nr:unnamed protein product [Trifolium pratense]
MVGRTFQAGNFDREQQSSSIQLSFTTEQQDRPYKILESNILSGSISPKGTSSFLSVISSSAWIIDSGASDHMTGDSTLFSSYGPCVGNHKIKIVDGSFSAIAGKGLVVLSPNLTLKDVLHVPNLSCSLMFVKDHRWTFKIGDHIRGTLVHEPKNISKLELRAIKCVFVGYSPTHKAYKTYTDPTQSSKTYISAPTENGHDSLSDPTPVMSGELGESEPTFSHEENNETLENDDNDDLIEMPQNNESYKDNRFEAGNKTKKRKAFVRKNHKESDESTSQHCHESKPGMINFLKQEKVALEIPKWREAVLEEMKALEKNKSWSVMTLPDGKKTVGCKWVFTVKYNSDGSIETYKARLVAKGFTQTYGIDYSETFAPVAKLNTVRILLSHAANLDWPLHHSLLELWFEKFTHSMKKQGYIQGQADHTLFTKFSKDGKIVVLIVYVDDIVLTGDDIVEMARVKEKLAFDFEIKDLCSMRYFLGTEVARSKDGIVVSQQKYILDLLKETRMSGCRPADTPMDPNAKLWKEGSVPVDTGRYQRLVGKLIYLSHTRPDIAFSVSVVSQFMHSPFEEHLEVVYRILRYLKANPGKGLFFKKTSERNVSIFTYADWAGSVTDRRATSGYFTYVWGNLVTWRSKKQGVVARSSAKAEFRAMDQGICEGLWIHRVLEELKMKIELPLKLYSDSKAAISIAHNPVQHDRTKHIEIDQHFIKEKLDAGIICLPFVTSTQQTANILTKSLARPTFELLIDKLGMADIYAPT